MSTSTHTSTEGYRNKVAAFALEQLSTGARQRDAESSFSREVWSACADFGLLGLSTPARYGGEVEGVDIPRAVRAMEGFGYGSRDNGLALGLNAQLWTVMLPINTFGTEAQKERFLPPMCSGEWIGAHALTEAEAGSDVYSMQMTATPTEGGYILNGTKRYITLGPEADVVLIFANARPKMGKWGITAFLVEKTFPGFKAGPNEHKMGLRSVPFGSIELTDCFVPTANRLGAEGAGFSIGNHSLEYDRCGILASNLGAMARQLEESVAYARQRKQFGQPIGQFQSVSNRIADMKLRLETARLLLYNLADKKQADEPALLESSMLKLYLSESFVASSLDAIRIRGGNGYLAETEVERDLRDAIGGIIYAGTSDIQRNIIAQLTGL
ncbi:acyl-CoA dehydrogenase family protein [Lewinella sp. 4G2]|uniref:acyl-CoA dehydrogenase family protein n=1 Tax=Lewinella sp. 4G2 TaxID=1803372 RepID=UPI0007B4AFA9|nr:acyl-CoA dehydrogenase family protein [Lewinella sp. 4G2]OAV43676.1 acyl-CoA dehydrogenase [Lewinella sp. 4G2]